MSLDIVSSSRTAATPLVGREGAGLSGVRPSILIGHIDSGIEHMPLPTEAVDGNHDIFPVPGLSAGDQGAGCMYVGE